MHTTASAAKKTKSLLVLPPENLDVQRPADPYCPWRCAYWCGTLLSVPGQHWFRTAVGWTQRLTLWSVRLPQPSSPCLISFGINAESRPVSTNICILNSVILPTLLYDLESTVLLGPHVRHLEAFVVCCLQIILGISVREKKRHTTIRKMARQQRISSIPIRRHLRFLGHLTRMPNDGPATQIAFLWQRGMHR